MENLSRERREVVFTHRSQITENQICERLLWVVCHVCDLLLVDSEEPLDISNVIVGFPAAAVQLQMKHLLLLSQNLDLS